MVRVIHDIGLVWYILALVNRDTTVANERCFGVVQLGRSITICVIGDLFLMY